MHADGNMTLLTLCPNMFTCSWHGHCHRDDDISKVKLTVFVKKYAASFFYIYTKPRKETMYRPVHNPRHDDMPPCYEDLVAPSGVTSGTAAALASVHALLSAAVALASTARSISRREKKGQCVQGVFFYLVAPLARTQPLLLNATHAGACGPRRCCAAARCCG